MQLILPKPNTAPIFDTKGVLIAYECLVVQMSIEELPPDVIPAVPEEMKKPSKPNHLKVVT